MRKHYIDNLRIICILLLFPFHSAMCFNAFGDAFYVTGEPNKALSMIVVGVYPWWMSLLFALAGISTVYALKKRSAGEYAKERVLRLLVPLVFGLLLIIPLQGYIGDVWNCAYSGGYFEHYIKFFTNLTDFSGNDGCFTPGNLWFILYLLVISIITLPITSRYAKLEKKPDFGQTNIFGIIIGGYLIVCALSLVGEIGDKGVGDFGACFLLGFFILSNDDVQKKLQKYALPFGIAWALLILIRCTLWGLEIQLDDLIWDLEYKALEWIGILAAVGIGGRFLDFDSGFTRYFAPAAFPLYVLHQTVLVVLAFVLVPLIKNTFLTFTAIMLLSFIITTALYELCRRFAVTRFILGIKQPKER